MRQAKHNPKIVTKKLTCGKTSIYLEYYYGRTSTPCLDENGLQVYYEKPGKNGQRIPKCKVTHDRRKKRLELYLITKPRTAAERLMNDEVMRTAEAIRMEAEQKFLQERRGYSVAAPVEGSNFFDFCDRYLATCRASYVGPVRSTVGRFKDYIRENYPSAVLTKAGGEVFRLSPTRMDKTMMRGFVDYLQRICKGGGAAVAFGRFNGICRAACEAEFLLKNPCSGIRCGGSSAVKDTLTPDEIQTLVRTHFAGENKEVRKAFIFSLYTGMRFCDTKNIRFDNIDFAAGVLTFDQVKTRTRSRGSVVTMQLHKGLLDIIGTPDSNGKKRDSLIFSLPGPHTCARYLGLWTKAAGIEKHITWHCARHSFGTNLSRGGAAPRDIAALLGHSGIQYVMRYTRATDKGKAEAIDMLPDIPL